MTDAFSAPSFPTPRRWHVLAACGAGVTALTFIYAGGAWATVLYELLTDGPILLAWLLAAAGWGTLFPLPRRDETSPELPGTGRAPPDVSRAPLDVSRAPRGVSRVALGLGVMSLLTLALGLAGVLNRPTAFAMVFLGLLLGAWRVLRITGRPPGLLDANAEQANCDVRGSRLYRAWLHETVTPWSWLWPCVVPFVAIVIIAALFPPGLLWGDEPHGYDVVAYHMQVPREWYELGKIVPLKHNVFSYFPFGVEMHFLLAMHLDGGPWAGMYLAQLMHATFCGLSVCAVYAVARTFASERNAILAAVACATVPYITLLAPVAYDEGGLLLYGVLAFGWVLQILVPSPLVPVGRGPGRGAGGNWPAEGTAEEAVVENESFAQPFHAAGVVPRSPLSLALSPGVPGARGPEKASGVGERTENWKHAVIAGVCAGFACGVKLTGVPVVLLALAGVVFVVLFVRRQIVRSFLFTSLLLAVGVAMFAPWCLRTTLWSGGNPVFPERMETLGRGHFTVDQVERWRLAHSPRPDQQRVAAKLQAAWEQIGADFRFGYVLLPLGIFAGLVAWRRTEARMLLGWLGLQLLFWLFLTHLQGRFFVLAVPTCALLLSCVHWRRAFVAPVALVIGTGAIGLWSLHGRVEKYLALDRQLGGDGQQVGLIGRTNLAGLLPFDSTRVTSPSVVVLVGDARAFWDATPSARLHYRSVFDVDASSGKSLAETWLGAPTNVLPPGSAVVTEYDEVGRFSRTYFKMPAPPDGAVGTDVTYVGAGK